MHEWEPFNAEPPRRAPAAKAITSANSFYSRNHGPIPQPNAETWRLTVDGRWTGPVGVGSIPDSDMRCQWTMRRGRLLQTGRDLLERYGVDVVGVAITSAESLQQA